MAGVMFRLPSRLPAPEEGGVTTVFGVATIAGTGALVATGSIIEAIFGAASIAGIGEIIATGARGTFGSISVVGVGKIVGTGELTNPPTPVDPFDSTEEDRIGQWFRHNKGTITFMTGPHFGKFEGLKDWDAVSPLLKINVDGREIHENYVYPVVLSHANDDVATTLAAITVLIDGLWPVLE